MRNLVGKKHNGNTKWYLSDKALIVTDNFEDYDLYSLLGDGVWRFVNTFTRQEAQVTFNTYFYPAGSVVHDESNGAKLRRNAMFGAYDTTQDLEVMEDE